MHHAVGDVHELRPTEVLRQLTIAIASGQIEHAEQRIDGGNGKEAPEFQCGFVAGFNLNSGWEGIATIRGVVVQQFKIVFQMLLTHPLEDSAAPGTVRAASASVIPLAAHHFVEQAGQGRHAGRVVGHDGTGQVGIGIALAAKEVPSL